MGEEVCVLERGKGDLPKLEGQALHKGEVRSNERAERELAWISAPKFHGAIQVSAKNGIHALKFFDSCSAIHEV